MIDAVSQPASESFKDFKDRLNIEQAGKTKQMVLQEHGGIDLDVYDNLPQQLHKWVERGAILSCEGANHPSHRHHLKTYT